jgi:ABC-type enterobactin transport system permease subunit
VPEKKVTAATLAGAIVTILIWILHMAHINIPAEVATAITTVIVFVAGYMAPHTHRPDLAEPAPEKTATTS